MVLLPIDKDQAQNARFQADPECVAILNIYPGFYERVGYHKPWIGYFATLDGDEIVGCGGYKGQPKEGAVEIAYGTFKKFEGQGVGTAICRQLVQMAVQTNPALRITARTLLDNWASHVILKRNGFVCAGTVWDDEDGEVLEWVLEKASYSAENQDEVL